MRVTAKHVLRTVQILLLLLLIVYLALLNARNPQTIDPLFFIPLPTVWVLSVALLFGFALGWVSLIGRVLKLQRENRSLRQRLIRGGLEPSLPQTSRTPRRQRASNELTRP